MTSTAGQTHKSKVFQQYLYLMPAYCTGVAAGACVAPEAGVAAAARVATDAGVATAALVATAAGVATFLSVTPFFIALTFTAALLMETPDAVDTADVIAGVAADTTAGVAADTTAGAADEAAGASDSTADAASAIEAPNTTAVNVMIIFFMCLFLHSGLCPVL